MLTVPKWVNSHKICVRVPKYWTTEIHIGELRRIDGSFHCCHALKESISVILNFSAASEHRQALYVTISCEIYMMESQFLHLGETYIWDNHRTIDYDNDKTPKIQVSTELVADEKDVVQRCLPQLASCFMPSVHLNLGFWAESMSEIPYVLRKFYI